MQVAAGRPSGRSHQRNRLMLADGLAGPHEQARQMGIARAKTLAMVDLDHLAIASSGPGKGNKTAGRRKDGRADRSRNVEPVMHPAGAKDRVAAIAEMRREFRHRRGFRGFARHGEHGFGFGRRPRSEEHTSELQSLISISYAFLS